MDNETKMNNTTVCQAKIELLYNGDYPGYPCIRVNNQWLTSEEQNALVSFFQARGLKDLFDRAGAWKVFGSEEHLPFEGVLSIIKK